MIKTFWKHEWPVILLTLANLAFWLIGDLSFCAFAAGMGFALLLTEWDRLDGQW